MIDIKFSRSGKKAPLYEGKFAYRSASPETDSLHIFNKSVAIETSRSSNSSDFLQAHNSTIFKQIVKALCLYYIVERRPNQLSEITITQTKSRATPISTSIHKAKLRQVVARTADLSVLHKVKQREASLLLSESPSGRAVLHAATHLIKSLDSSSPFDRFEKLWRAFNALYKAFAKASTDHACHVVLRKHIEDFPKSFPLSIAEVGPLSADDIRGQILWNQMILNNHPTQAKTQALKEAILRNSDHRILQIYNDSLPVRKTFLVRGGFYEEIVNHIQNGITAKFVRDSDVISILCIKYMYFVRNKIAHAERADHGFSFLHGSTDESEIRWLAPFLEALVIDLINISYTF
jgi:hypothetical protein